MAESAAIVVVGATGGIGSCLARRLAGQGAGLTLVARTPGPLSDLASQLGANHLPADVSSFDEAESVMAEAKETYGRVDGVVSCAGSILIKPAHLTSREDYDEVISRNLTTAFSIVRAAARVMKTNGGAIVLVSSCAARAGLANHEAISAAKAGVIGLAQSAAASYATDGIRVNVVAPGLTRTPAVASITSNPTAEKASRSMHPLGRLGEPDDIASAIQWLLGREASWITGQVIGVDGGLATLRAKARV